MLQTVWVLIAYHAFTNAKGDAMADQTIVFAVYTKNPECLAQINLQRRLQAVDPGLPDPKHWVWNCIESKLDPAHLGDK